MNRVEILIGKEKMESLKNKHVLVCGTGGVGSFVIEALARSGVGNITIVDHDVIDISNLNRQLMTNYQNVGLSKVDELKKRVNSYCECNIIAIKQKVDEQFQINDNYDYVIDCIDDLKAKFHLAKLANEKKIKFIAAMGGAKRIAVDNLIYTRLEKTQNDPLARAYRHLVRKNKFKGIIKVVYYDKPAMQLDDNRKLGSTIFAPASLGLKIASIVFEELIGGINEI